MRVLGSEFISLTTVVIDYYGSKCRVLHSAVLCYSILNTESVLLTVLKDDTTVYIRRTAYGSVL